MAATATYRIGNLWRRGVTRLLGDDYLRADGRCRLGPEWLVLVVNNFCNLRCKMCDVGLKETGTVFYTHLIGNDPRNMSLEMLDAILDQAAGFFPRPKIGLAFTEPLIHPRILDFCRRITGRGFFCSITSNGFLLPRLADELAAIGVDEITISIDGPEDAHDRIRGRAGSFRNLATGVERLNAARARLGWKRPVVRFSYTLTDENYTRMVDFLRQVEDLRPASYNFSHLNFISDEIATIHNARYGAQYPVVRSNLGMIDPGAIDIKAMWDALAQLKAFVRSRPDFPPVTIVPDARSVQDLEVYYRRHDEFVGGRNCTDPWRLLMIRTDGTVAPAHGRCYDVPFGNLTEAPLTQLWNTARAREFRRTLQAAGGTLPACARCCGVIGKPTMTQEMAPSGESAAEPPRR